MAKSKVICRYCKKEIDKEKAYSEKPRWYFCDKSCHDAFYNMDEGKKEMFLDYIWALYDKEYRTNEKYMLISKQAEHYHREYKFKYEGMLLTAKWNIEVLENPWKNEYGLGQFLPDKYMQLKHHYEQQQQLKEMVNKVKENKTKVSVAGKTRKRLSLE